MRTLADLHFHLLPGVDDGPTTLAASLELARDALRQGTGTIVATPHVKAEFPTDLAELPERVRELQAALQAEGMAVAVRRGAEVGHDMVPRLSQRELESVALGPPGARWILLEAPLDPDSPGPAALETTVAEFDSAAEELRRRGFGALIAHPERSPALVRDGAAALRAQLRRGALAQVNAYSLDGRHGSEARAVAFDLVASGLVAAVASDAHGPDRPPALALALSSLVRGGVAPDRAWALVCSAPRGLLARGIAQASELAA